MKAKWHERFYIDLFAGAGKGRARESNRILLGSSLLALKIRVPFDRYIFCDEDSKSLAALRHRVAKEHSDIDARFLLGDVNVQTERILDELPRFSQNHRVLGFCFADPYQLQELKFSTILALSERYMDFLIHIPAMDPQRAWRHYLNPSNHTVDDFFGTSEWRSEWESKTQTVTFDRFVADFLGRRMKAQGFQYGGIREAELIRSISKNTPLYRLGFFSKNKLGEKFWVQAKKYSAPQGKLF